MSKRRCFMVWNYLDSAEYIRLGERSTSWTCGCPCISFHQRIVDSDTVTCIRYLQLPTVAPEALCKGVAEYISAPLNARMALRSIETGVFCAVHDTEYCLVIRRTPARAQTAAGTSRQTDPINRINQRHGRRTEDAGRLTADDNCFLCGGAIASPGMGKGKGGG